MNYSMIDLKLKVIHNCRLSEGDQIVVHHNLVAWFSAGYQIDIPYSYRFIVKKLKKSVSEF